MQFKVNKLINLRLYFQIITRKSPQARFRLLRVELSLYIVIQKLTIDRQLMKNNYRNELRPRYFVVKGGTHVWLSQDLCRRWTQLNSIAYRADEQRRE